jgi:hypothetical protein
MVCFVQNAPVYGVEVDKKLLEDVRIRREAGITITHATLRSMLIVRLNQEKLLHLLIENGGQHTFGDGWSKRFFKRHGLTSRAVTTKMREVPADFQTKKMPKLGLDASS